MRYKPGLEAASLGSPAADFVPARTTPRPSSTCFFAVALGDEERGVGACASHPSPAHLTCDLPDVSYGPWVLCSRRPPSADGYNNSKASMTFLLEMRSRRTRCAVAVLGARDCSLARQIAPGWRSLPRGRALVRLACDMGTGGPLFFSYRIAYAHARAPQAFYARARVARTISFWSSSSTSTVLAWRARAGVTVVPCTESARRASLRRGRHMSEIWK